MRVSTMTSSRQDEEQRPLSRFRLLRSADVDTVEAVAGRVFSPHRLMPGRSGPLSAELDTVDVGALRFIYFACGAPVTVDSKAPLSYYAVNLPLGGGARVRLGAEEINANPATAVVFSPVEQIGMTWSEDLRQLCVKIDASALQEHARRLTPQPLRPVRFEPRLVATGVGSSSWVEVVRLAEQTLRTCPGGVLPSALARQFEQMVMTTLLLQQPSSCSEQLLQQVPAASVSAVRRVSELIHDVPERQFTVADLAEHAGVSIRALQEGFRRQHGMTPTEYLTEIRLVRARELIERGEPPPTRVADVAYQSGFLHLGRFAQRYRQRFGVSPSAAIRLRGAGASRPDDSPA